MAYAFLVASELIDREPFEEAIAKDPAPPLGIGVLPKVFGDWFKVLRIVRASCNDEDKFASAASKVRLPSDWKPDEVMGAMRRQVSKTLNIVAGAPILMIAASTIASFVLFVGTIALTASLYGLDRTQTLRLIALTAPLSFVIWLTLGVLLRVATRIAGLFVDPCLFCRYARLALAGALLIGMWLAMTDQRSVDRPEVWSAALGASFGVVGLYLLAAALLVRLRDQGIAHFARENPQSFTVYTALLVIHYLDHHYSPTDDDRRSTLTAPLRPLGELFASLSDRGQSFKRLAAGFANFDQELLEGEAGRQASLALLTQLTGYVAVGDWNSAATIAAEGIDSDHTAVKRHRRASLLQNLGLSVLPIGSLLVSPEFISLDDHILSIAFVLSLAWMVANLAITVWGDESSERIAAIVTFKNAFRRE